MSVWFGCSAAEIKNRWENFGAWLWHAKKKIEKMQNSMKTTGKPLKGVGVVVDIYTSDGSFVVVKL
jgi:hypothetical protein